MCASSELQFGGLREGGGTRKAGSTIAESLVVLYQVGTHQIRRRRRAARSLTSQGRAEPLCARIESANREVSEGKADLRPRSFFFLRGPLGTANGQDSWGFFKDAQGFGRLDAGLRAGFTSSRPPPQLLFPHISPISRTRGHRRRLPFPYHRYIQKTQTKEEKERKKNNRRENLPRSDRRGRDGPRYFIFPYLCTVCGLEKLGILLIKIGWNVFVRFVAENARRG